MSFSIFGPILTSEGLAALRTLSDGDQHSVCGLADDINEPCQLFDPVLCNTVANRGRQRFSGLAEYVAGA